MNFNQFCMTNSIANGVEDLHDLFTAVFLGMISTYTMTMQNEHDANIAILYPTDNGIRHAKLIEVHHSNIS